MRLWEGERWQGQKQGEQLDGFARIQEGDDGGLVKHTDEKNRKESLWKLQAD